MSIPTRALAALVLAASLLISSVTQALADPRDFMFTNGTSSQIKNLYVSSSAIESWEEDILGRDVLAAGEQWTITFGKYDAGNCLYDIKAVYADGSPDDIVRGVDLCAYTNIIFTNTQVIGS